MYGDYYIKMWIDLDVYFVIFCLVMVGEVNVVWFVVLWVVDVKKGFIIIWSNKFNYIIIKVFWSICISCNLLIY